MKTVVDASFVLDVLISVAGVELDASARGMVAEGVIAPPIFWHEVASGLRNMVRRGRITSEFRPLAWERVVRWNVAVEAPQADLSRVIALSDHWQLTIYDAAYLELAQRTGSRLASRDQALIAAAGKAGVEFAPLV